MKTYLIIGLLMGGFTATVFGQGVLASKMATPLPTDLTSDIAVKDAVAPLLTSGSTMALAHHTDSVSASVSGFAPLVIPEAPEPTSIVLGGLGAAALLFLTRRQK